MRTIFVPILTVLVLASVAFAADAPVAPGVAKPDPAELKVVPLREAAVTGDVGVLGVQPGSYRQVTLRIENRTDEELSVDLVGSFLRPKKKGSCQRLGLGPAITPNATLRSGKGTIVVKLAPRETRELRLNTVCLDAGRPAPMDHEFVVAPDPLPPVRLKVMKWWADHPDAAQGQVNSAIWRFSETVNVRPGTAANYHTPKGTFSAVHGGTYYRLDDGELTCLDTVGVERILGSQMFSVMPCDGAVYSVGLSDSGDPELLRLALTGEQPWGRIMPLGESIRVLEVVPAGRGRIAVVTDGGLFVRDLAAGRTTPYFAHSQILDLFARQVSDSALLVALKVPAKGGHYQGGERKGQTSDIFELWSLDVAGGEPTLVKRFWNVRAMVLGPAGIFGLSHLGVLRKIVGKSFKNFGPGTTFKQIVAVGRKVVWAQTLDNRLVAINVRTGGHRDTGLETSDGFYGRVDAVTDDLAFTSEGRFFLVSAESGEIREIPAPR
jgi:hypothetical protein